jgi:hypothetical protein
MWPNSGQCLRYSPRFGTRLALGRTISLGTGLSGLVTIAPQVSRHLRLSVRTRQVPLVALASGTQRAQTSCHGLLVRSSLPCQGIWHCVCGLQPGVGAAMSIGRDQHAVADVHSRNRHSGSRYLQLRHCHDGSLAYAMDDQRDDPESRRYV